MKVLDVNVVLPAHRADHPDHTVARPWLEQLWAQGDQFTVPWLVWWSFLRVATNRRVFATPTPVREAERFIEAVRAQPGHLALDAVPDGHLHRLCSICESGQAIGDLVPDAVLATLAVDCGGEVVSFDRDFGRFPELRWTVPTLD